MDAFRPFSLTHAFVIVAFVALTATVIAARRRLRRYDPARADRFDRRLGVATAIVWLVVTVVLLLPRYFDRRNSFPLHVCDFTILTIPLGLLTCWRPARAIAYFWGIGLSTQGLITPDLRFGPAAVRFYVFWAAHFVIVGGAIYDVVARGYRPTWKDCAVAIGTGVVYVALILPFDLATNLNYGYVGRSAPGQPTLVDALGPWPGRVGIMMGLGAVMMVVLVLPWEIARLIRRPRRPAADASLAPDASAAP